MNCQEVQTLIHGYMDYELDAAKSLEVEQHLADCAHCASALEGFRRLSRAIAQNAAYYRAPAALETRIRSAVRSSAAPARPSFTTRWSLLAAAALVIFGMVWALPRLISPVPNELLVEEVTASHVRSLMGNHLVDVYSSDQHTVKPWFDGKLDYAPAVVDLKASGFPLVGGRLDYLDGRPVAALVYRRYKHLINFYLWPTRENDASLRTITRQGYHIDYWTKNGMEYWAVSDVSPTELSAFVQLIQQSGSPAPESSR